MATEEYLLRFLEKGRRYEDLPPRFKQTLSEEEWRRKCVLKREGVGGENDFDLFEGPNRCGMPVCMQCLGILLIMGECMHAIVVSFIGRGLAGSCVMVTMLMSRHEREA